jgi:hypothetical protein
MLKIREKDMREKLEENKSETREIAGTLSMKNEVHMANLRKTR